jgi:GR25 family glycosyltransferase involved in LPS biosynthesis
MVYARAAGIQNIQHLPAVDAKEFTVAADKHPSISILTAHNIQYNVRRSHYEIDHAGGIGCSLSHINAWKECRQTQSKAIIIFEDDAMIPPNFLTILNSLLLILPPDWDMVTLTEDPSCTNTNKSNQTNQKELYSCTGLTGSHAYMLSAKGAEILLSRAFPIELHVDAYMAFMARTGYIEMLWYPAINIKQPFDDSDIFHGRRQILNVPTNLEQTNTLVIQLQTVLSLMILAGITGGLISLAFFPSKRR